MKLVLLDRINRLGNIGDEVNVKAGFARNYLLPQGKALIATAENIEYFESQRIELEKASQDKLVQAQGLAKQLSDLGAITITAKASEEGKLYGSIKQTDIVKFLAEKDIAIEKNMIHMSESITHIGEYSYPLQLHSDVTITCKVLVGAE